MSAKQKEINKQLLAALRPELDSAVESVAKAHGLTLSFGNARFDAFSATMTLNIGIAASENYDPDKAVWDANCTYVGLKPEDYGKETVISGERFTICGYNPNARTNRIRIRSCVSGKEFVASASVVKDGMEEYRNAKTNTLLTPSPEMQWTMYCRIFGLHAEDFGKRIILNGSSYTISGCDPKARKNVVLITKDATGKVYRTDAETVRTCLVPSETRK